MTAAQEESPFDDLVWRHVPKGAHALHAGYILQARGRWNRQGEYGCLYTSLTKEGAAAEYHKELARVSGLAPEEDQPRDLVSIYALTRHTLDLTQPLVRKRFGISLGILTGDSAEDIEMCRTVADLARLEGYNAILSPSAAIKGKENLNLYIDGRAADLRLMEGPHREPLNY